MFFVHQLFVSGFQHVTAFRTEREAREWINTYADGDILFTLIDGQQSVIVQSRCPVLMVA